MSFQSLYRRYRPQRFGELVGQDHVTIALRNAVREDRVGHAYLFSGPRGTGKTTSARILAKALNCTDRGDDGEPCGVCDSCVEIAKGSSMDVIELDAASNNGVAEMRALLERVSFRSAGGRHRVYIIDEVHMLSKGASNALLKTLEEPPDHVIFVLATTDPQAVLPTIRSRTQHFEFSLLSTEVLASYLATIAEHEKLDADADTFRLVARRGGGSPRDALSLLDQAVALGGGSLDIAGVRALFEATPFTRQAELVEAVAAQDVAGVLGTVQSLLDTGVDARQVADDLLRYLRNVFVVTEARGRVDVGVLDEERDQLAAHGEALGTATVVRAIETLGEAAVDMRRAPDPRLVLEVTLVRLARREAGSRVEVLLERVDRLERALDELRAAPPASRPADARPAPEAASPAPEPARDPGGATSRDPASRPALGGVRRERPASAAAPPATTPAATPEATPGAPSPEATPGEASAAAPAPEADEPAPSSEAREPAPPSSLDLDDVVLAWPEALGLLKPRLRAMAREAQPVEIDGATVVLGIPEQYTIHGQEITKQASTVAGALAKALDVGHVEIRLLTHDDFLPSRGSDAAGGAATRGDGAGAGGASAAPAGTERDDGADDESVEIDESGPVVDEAALDSVGLLKDAFGATVEEDPDA